MENRTYQSYLTDYSMREQIEREARRAQAEAIAQYLFPLLVRFCAWLTSIRIGLQSPRRAGS